MVCTRFALALLLLLTAIAPVSFAQTLPYDPDRLYAPDTLKADLHFLKERLERIHPNLYSYTPRPAFEAFFDSLDHAIARPMKEQEFLSLITLLNAKTGDGHTMFLPGEAATEYNNIQGRFLPFSVACIDGRLYITENGSNDSAVLAGLEIVSINGVAAPVILAQLLARQIRDGHNLTYPLWILSHYFAAYYSFVFGRPQQFALALKNKKGVMHTLQIAALTKDSIRLLRAARARQAAPTKGIVLEQAGAQTAILTIKSLDAELLSDSYGQDFKQVIDSVFTQLQRLHIRRLILDLRDNQGGDFESGRYLLSRLSLQPSRYLMDGKEARLLRPGKHHFTGKLFTLINGGSFSNTAIVCACLERDRRSVFIGTETGGNKYNISGDAVEEVLPHTRIRSFISTAIFRIHPGKNEGHGVYPAYPVRPSIGDLLEGRDVAKALAVKLIALD